MTALYPEIEPYARGYLDSEAGNTASHPGLTGEIVHATTASSAEIASLPVSLDDRRAT